MIIHIYWQYVQFFTNINNQKSSQIEHTRSVNEIFQSAQFIIPAPWTLHRSLQRSKSASFVKQQLRQVGGWICTWALRRAATARVAWRCFHSVWASNWKTEGPSEETKLLAGCRPRSEGSSYNQTRCISPRFNLAGARRSVSSVALRVSSVRPPLYCALMRHNWAFGSRVPHFIFFKAALEVAYKMKEKSLSCTMAERVNPHVGLSYK